MGATDWVEVDEGDRRGNGGDIGGLDSERWVCKFVVGGWKLPRTMTEEIRSAGMRAMI